MTITHEEYLKRMLETRKNELRELNICHRIAEAKYEALRQFTSSQIDSIERQLEDK